MSRLLLVFCFLLVAWTSAFGQAWPSRVPDPYMVLYIDKVLPSGAVSTHSETQNDTILVKTRYASHWDGAEWPGEPVDHAFILLDRDYVHQFEYQAFTCHYLKVAALLSVNSDMMVSQQDWCFTQIPVRYAFLGANPEWEQTAVSVFAYRIWNTDWETWLDDNTITVTSGTSATYGAAPGDYLVIPCGGQFIVKMGTIPTHPEEAWHGPVNGWNDNNPDHEMTDGYYQVRIEAGMVEANGDIVGGLEQLSQGVKDEIMASGQYPYYPSLNPYWSNDFYKGCALVERTASPWKNWTMSLSNRKKHEARRRNWFKIRGPVQKFNWEGIE